MRHGKKFNHLGRQAPHRKAMLSNMSASLILHKRISTTLAKAKELKKHVEPLVTRAKEDTTHNRRVAFSFLQSKEAIKALFGDVAEKVGSRPGGYTRIIKTGFRLGDNAEMCIIELVDFNELMLKEAKPAKATTRRSRRGSGKAPAETSSADQAKQETAEKKETAKPKVAPKDQKAEKAAAEDATDQKEENTSAAKTQEAAPKADEGKASAETSSADQAKPEAAENKEVAKPKAEPKGTVKDEKAEKTVADDATDQKEEDASAAKTPKTAPKADEGKADETDASEDDKKAK